MEAPTPEPAAMPPASSYPIQLDVVTPPTMERWRILQWFLAIPHFVVLYLLRIALEVVTVIAWFAILFTGEYPEGLFRFAVGVQRWEWRVTTYAYFLHERYPPFELESAGRDPADQPPLYAVADPPGPRNRVTTFFRLILVIPHLIVLSFLGIGAAVALIIAWFAVLFTGQWPEGLRNFVVGTGRWLYRVNGYFGLLTDEYPPFSLEP